MGELKGYGLIDYAGAQKYEDFLEKGEEPIFMSEKVEYTYATGSSTSGGTTKYQLVGPFILTNFRAFMVYEQPSLTGFLSGKKKVTLGAEAIYDYEYAKKAIIYATDAIKRIAAAGVKGMDAAKEEREHRPNPFDVNILVDVEVEKAFLGGKETIHLKVKPLPIGKSSALSHKIGFGAMKLFSLGLMKEDAFSYPVDTIKPFEPASPRASRYEGDPKLPRTGRAVQFLMERKDDINGKLEDLVALAKKSESV